MERLVYQPKPMKEGRHRHQQRQLLFLSPKSKQPHGDILKKISVSCFCGLISTIFCSDLPSPKRFHRYGSYGWGMSLIKFVVIEKRQFPITRSHSHELYLARLRWIPLN